MCPDINSLPPSRSSSASPRQARNLPTSSDAQPAALHSSGFSPAPATMNNNNSHNNQHHAIDIPRRPSRSSRAGVPGPERRRSAAGANFNLNHNEPTGDPAPSDHRSSLGHHGLRASSPSSLGGSPIIATGDPHHQRAPSLGELHQELEQEQEAQVNRLLHMIRSQQNQLQQLQQQQQGSQGTAIEDSDRAAFPALPPVSGSGSRMSAQFPTSLSSRRPSRPSSQATSPSLRPLADAPRGPEGPEWFAGTSESSARRSSRDEGAFYQAEATMLARENQILRQRIRDLERQVSELTTISSAGGVRSGEINAPPATEGGETADRHATAGLGSTSEPADKT
ncbi:hypothetical protein ETB97_006797 [Aspergillus alliaceus]|uniref:Uncharacterized protein n=1 Tax=Petromyces alliaceus TaxID=209559 RepID=A0A5N6FZJ8_PETAA|nr:uncharacterized protein BDW43DRAFT_270258 [Aspergillus alliaceus]KAB8235461.1 hypothetical protein BDW43DRAFT_270258 [Aspergillus alliaceus]KAF5866953.1 hypothetical protein ETB97_006797 [Aspergillus burnettii]